MKTSIISPVKAQIQLQTQLLLDVLNNISEQEADLKVSEDLNTIKWIAGHIVNTRFSLLNIIAQTGENAEFSKFFGKGTSKKEFENYPAMSTIIEELEYVTTEIFKHFEELTDEFLNSKAPFQTSIPDDTILGLVAFLFLHEANHCGQISMLRKLSKNQFQSDISLYDRVICN